MAELDAELGVGNGKRRRDPREVGAPVNNRSTPAVVNENSVMSDDVLAAQRMEQAEKMKASAQQLMAEAERLINEAVSFDPSLKPKTTKANAKKKPVKAD